MALFQGKKFLFLPNCRSSTLSFLSQLIRSNDGTVICDVEELDKQMITLINKSFIDKDQKLTNKELFLKEFEMDPDIVWSFILHERPACVEANCISEWLKIGKITLPPEFNVLIDEEDTTTGFHVINEHAGQSNKEASDRESSMESQSDTDIGSETSHKDSHESPFVQAASREESLDNPISETVANADLVDEENVSKNETLIKAFGRLARRYEIKGDQYRSKGYKLAKIGIERYPHEILSGEQARRDIASVGPGIAKKIQIILDTGSLPGLDESFDLEKKLNYFTQCHDVGIYSAKRWNLLGLQSFADVLKKFPEVFIRDWPILFGWSYYEDWLMKMCRDECDEILNVVRTTLKRVDPACSAELQGSYVRGAQECGDLDILFHKKGCDNTTELGRIMEKLALALYDQGYVECFLQLSPKIRQVFGSRIRERVRKCKLKIPSQEEYPPAVADLKKYFLGFKLKSEFKPRYLETSADKLIKLETDDRFMSLSSSSHPCRRVDFFCCKYSELGAARIQWTGPKEFNRWIRIKAVQKGMKLTQHGLYRGENILLESFDDKRIFELLGEEYVGPEDRNRMIKKRQKQS
ncbi:hypothetical protein HG536_0C03080 [Torulaspora globosa]|uniref:DNA polymerase n=1 Tax=Torulaspora globosa TaxID=48254 RepID=A0A7G3ZF54_9SACH|nr:uncharacterized protein HG536_0C03080 [Torulaspora globosa]QLL32140.1 hypothetical protein HG536_0C03080 [Torulaspora globosa]